MKSKIKSINWVLVIIMGIISWYLVRNVNIIPEFLMVPIRQTGPGALIIPYFIYAWLLFAIFFFKGKTMEKVSIYALATTVVGVGALYLYEWLQPWLADVFY